MLKSVIIAKPDVGKTLQRPLVGGESFFKMIEVVPFETTLPVIVIMLTMILKCMLSDNIKKSLASVNSYVFKPSFKKNQFKFRKKIRFINLNNWVN